MTLAEWPGLARAGRKPGAPIGRAPASHYAVSITKGSLNSYNLIVVGEGIQYKAKRIR